MTFKEFLIENNIDTTFYNYSQATDILYPFSVEYTSGLINLISFDKFMLAFKQRFSNRVLVETYDTVQEFVDDFYSCVFGFYSSEMFYRLPLISIMGKIASSKYTKQENTLTNTINTVTDSDTTATIDEDINSTIKDYYAPANTLDLTASNLKGGNTGVDITARTETQNNDVQQTTTQTTTTKDEVYGELSAQEIELLQDYNNHLLPRLLNYFEPLFIGVF